MMWEGQWLVILQYTNNVRTVFKMETIVTQFNLGKHAFHFFLLKINNCRQLFIWTHISVAATILSPQLLHFLSYNLWTLMSNTVNSIYKSNTLICPPVLSVMLLHPINLITCWQKRRRQSRLIWSLSGCCAFNLVFNNKLYRIFAAERSAGITQWD